METAPPPAAEYGDLPRRKTFFTFSDLHAPPIFSSKRMRTFFCGSLPSMNRADGGAGSGSQAKNFLPPTPSTCYQTARRLWVKKKLDCGILELWKRFYHFCGIIKLTIKVL